MNLPSDDESTKKEDIWWWVGQEPPEESLPFDFCRDTSLHGLKYIYQPQRHLSERIFWLVSFIIGLGLTVYLISGVWKNYRDKPIIVAFEPFETTVDDIPFPAITVCNMNKVLRTNAENIIQKLKQVPHTTHHQNEDQKESLQRAFQLDHICSVSAGFSKAFQFSLSQGSVNDSRIKNLNSTGDDGEGSQMNIEEFLQEHSQKCPDMLPLCIWKDNVQNCTRLFNPIETDFGKCCTFNMVSQSLLHKFKKDSRDDPEEVRQWMNWNVERDGLLITDHDESNSREFPRRQRRAGKSFGLSILLDPNLAEYFCTTSDSVGFRLAAHLSIDVPHVADFGIGISPNSEVFVNIRPEITMADDAIKGFPLDKRRCYFPKDYGLRYYNYYTTSNCIDECIAEETQKSCGCVRYYMPRPENASLCGPLKFECAENVKKQYILQGFKTKCLECRRTCTEIQYYMETTTTPLLYDKTNWMYSNGTFARWRENNVSIVHLFIGQPSTYARVRKQLYGGTDLMANTGGLMGLCLGFSGLSLVELVYYFTLRAFWRRKRKLEKVGSSSSSILNTVLDAWTKTKAFTAGTSFDKPRLQNPGSMDIRPRRNIRNQTEIVRELNSTFLPPQSRSHFNAFPGYNNYSDSTSVPQAMFHEIAPFYRDDKKGGGRLDQQQKTQYWHL